MTNLTDARLLFRTWAQSFDPSSSGELETASSPVQEAWLSLAAAAKLLNSEEEEPVHVIPGLLYLLTWSAKDRWADRRAPRFTQIGLTFFTEGAGARDFGWYVLEQQEGGYPIPNYVPYAPETIRRIPGIVYPPFPPIQD